MLDYKKDFPCLFNLSKINMLLRNAVAKYQIKLKGKAMLL